jgi:hypothetical protein
MSFPDPIRPVLTPPPGYSPLPQAPGVAGVLTNDGLGNLTWEPAGTGGSGGPSIVPTPTAGEADRVLMTPVNAPLNPFWSSRIDQGRW